MPLILILADCGIELIPKEIRGHSAVKTNLKIKKYYSQLLDNALHHSAMSNLKNHDKRGRPDIAHLCLLNALGSPLNKSGNLTIYLHTNQNKIFKFNPEVRIARNYNRFKGLIVNLLLDKQIIYGEKELITLYDGTLKELIHEIDTPETYLLSTKGKLYETYSELFLEGRSKNYIVIVGSFQKGGFSKEIMSLSENMISISHYSLDAWVVVSKIIGYYELNYNVV